MYLLLLIIDTLPEGGEQDPKAAALLVSQISDWEQNWLFKRRKQLFKKRNLMAEAVPMLVPNPNEDGIEPQIGEEKASDLSDLSDHVNDDEDADFTMSSEEEEDIPEKTEESNIDSTNTRRESDTKIELISAPASSPQQKKEVVQGKENVSSEQVRPVEAKTNETRKTPIPKKPERKVEKGITFSVLPEDCKTSSGKTAKFFCEIRESPLPYSVAWFFEGGLVTSEKGKRWIYSIDNTNQHYLYVYDVNAQDAGNYHISIFDHRGNETKHCFKLILTGEANQITCKACGNGCDRDFLKRACIYFYLKKVPNNENQNLPILLF